MVVYLLEGRRDFGKPEVFFREVCGCLWPRREKRVGRVGKFGRAVFEAARGGVLEGWSGKRALQLGKLGGRQYN